MPQLAPTTLTGRLRLVLGCRSHCAAPSADAGAHEGCYGSQYLGRPTRPSI